MMTPQHDVTSASARPGTREAIAGVLHEPRDQTPLAVAMTADDILAHPALGGCVRTQAQALLRTYQARPRMALPFATRRRRWLMAQAALAKYFRNEAARAGSGVLAEHFIDLVARHDLASRNTAAAFIQEMLKYGIVRHAAASAGRRHRPFEPSPTTLAVVLHWHIIHLATLDALDGGQRSATLHNRPARLGAIQPLIADGLLASNRGREPDKTFSWFTWINDGGIVVDRLIAGCQEAAGQARIPTDVTSVSALAQDLNLSRTQLGRKFAAAEAIGGLGWSGTRGKSRLWVSSDFWHDYHAAQAAKLAIIDAAFEACFAKAP